MFDGTPRGALTAMMIRCCSTSGIWCTWKTFFPFFFFFFFLLLLLLFLFCFRFFLSLFFFSFLFLLSSLLVFLTEKGFEKAKNVEHSGMLLLALFTLGIFDSSLSL